MLAYLGFNNEHFYATTVEFFLIETDFYGLIISTTIASSVGNPGSIFT